MSIICKTCFKFKLRNIRNVSTFTEETIMNLSNRQRCIEKFRAMKRIKLLPNTPTSSASVLIPLCTANNELSLLYTLRSNNLRTHRGQVAFPGGKQDIGEDLIQTALRETEEELGIPQHKVDVWGTGNLIVPMMPPSIMPVIGYIRDYDYSALKLNTTEVSKAFTVPLKDLCDLDKIRHTQFGYYSSPVYLACEERIWGMTALLTHMFLSSLIPDAYNYTLPVIYKNKQSVTNF